MREHELVALDMHQYQQRGLQQVRRKGAKVTTRIELPREARQALDIYVKEVRGALWQNRPGFGPAAGSPLFVGRGGNRLTVRGVAYICERLAAQASVNLPADEKFHLTPHQLRHTFLRRVADKHGLHFAQELSGSSLYQAQSKRHAEDRGGLVLGRRLHKIAVSPG